MRIALVHKRFDRLGGTERQLVGLAGGLSRLGHDVHVFAARIDPALASARGITLHRVPALRGGVLLKAASFFLAARRAVSAHAWDVVVALGRTWPADVYRAGGGCHAAYHASLVARARGWRRAWLAVDPYHRFLLWVERRQLGPGGARRVVAVSRLAAAELVARYPEAESRVRVVWNGVDLERFHPRTRDERFDETRRALGVEPHEDLVLFVGNGWERKGLDIALAVLARLADPDVRLVVVGSDAHPEGFEHRARDLGVRSHVAFLGEVAAVERLLAAADLLLLPTRYDPFANACLEALAAGVPVVTSSRNGAAEILSDCGAARVVGDPEDVEALAAAARDLLRVPDRRALSRVARARAERHGEGEAVGRMVEVFVEARAGSAGGSGA